MSVNPAVVIAFLSAILLSFGVAIWYKVKSGVKVTCFIAGAFCFTFFALYLESIVHSFVLNANISLGKTILGSPVLYMLYAAFAAGIFEETARLVGFKVLLKNHNEKSCAYAYGIGHGGIEVFILLGGTYLVYLLASLGVPVGDETVTAQAVQVANSIPLSNAFIGILERVSAMSLHVGLSLIVFIAARVAGKMWLYPVAILVHAIADAPAALCQMGQINVYVMEAFAFVFGIATLFVGIRLLKNTDDAALHTAAKAAKEKAAVKVAKEQAAKEARTSAKKKDEGKTE
ncbi:MAG: YhfC family glutamic-type intramembrane protease [Eubacteriales bacterium]|nr:YhfC family glutamic-type intramembrane protease [Eubacteriales bacterium]